MRRSATGRRIVSAIALAGAGMMASTAGQAFETGIGTAAITRAIDLGRSPGSEPSRRFHDRYVIHLGDPILDRLEIVTEFRRVVLATEERARLAEMKWGPEQAEAMLRPWRDKVSLLLHLTFSPNNTYRAMPRVGIVLYAPASAAGASGGQSMRIDPIDLVETPRYISGQPAPPGTPILAGIVEATFAAAALDRRGTYLAGIFLEDRELRRIDIDFGRIE